MHRYHGRTGADSQKSHAALGRSGFGLGGALALREQAERVAAAQDFLRISQRVRGGGQGPGPDHPPAETQQREREQVKDLGDPHGEKLACNAPGQHGEQDRPIQIGDMVRSQDERPGARKVLQADDLRLEQSQGINFQNGLSYPSESFSRRCCPLYPPPAPEDVLAGRDCARRTAFTFQQCPQIADRDHRAGFLLAQGQLEALLKGAEEFEARKRVQTQVQLQAVPVARQTGKFKLCPRESQQLIVLPGFIFPGKRLLRLDAFLPE